MVFKVYVFGNSMIEEDSLAVKLIPKLRKRFKDIEFIHLDPNEDLMEMGENPVIIDVAKGIDKPVVLEDVNMLITEQIHTMHDFDIAQNLKLMKSAGIIDSVRIYALPYDYSEKKALEWLVGELERG